MISEYKYFLIENENDMKMKMINKFKNIESLDELIESIDEIISIQYFKGLFIDPDEYDEIISSKLDKIINNTFDEIKSNSSVLNPESFNHDESEYKYYLIMLLDKYDIFLSEYSLKTNITKSGEIKALYLIELYDELDEIKKPEYLDEIITYEDENDLYAYIDELISCFLSDASNKDNMIFRYFNYDEFISDLKYSDELYEINNSYVTDINRLY